MKNKVEAQPRKVNKKNHVVKTIRDVDVKHLLLNANSICATCCPDCSVESGLRMFKTYDKEPLSAHELCQSNQYGMLPPNPVINPPLMQQTPYEHLQDKKPDLSFFYVFGALCYPTNDNDDLGKLDAKADNDIFVGYAPAKKAFRIYNKRTLKIIDTIRVTFNELTTMASEQFSSGPRLHSMTPTIYSSRLMPNTVSQQPFPVAAAPRAVDLADSPVSTSIDQDAPSTSIPSTQKQEHSLNISQGSSSNVRQTHTLFEHHGRWTKDHPIENVIGDPSCYVSTRKKLQIDVMWCYFDAFLTLVEPKNFKQAMTEPSWIDAMQEEIHQFERLQV
uniref:Retrovirus-related Pol polyprotein from transposon TNT 1-94 n=1 Tax=Tanacetum cinerariifolium TaxID=118510 RepID=A0A699GTY4_TANCI|nr:retrovirus-related Pol polyprotein from transposon TNT 1-94 [Tanacetum cinerariifolium]